MSQEKTSIIAREEDDERQIINNQVGLALQHLIDAGKALEYVKVPSPNASSTQDTTLSDNSIATSPRLKRKHSMQKEELSSYLSKRRNPEDNITSDTASSDHTSPPPLKEQEHAITQTQTNITIPLYVFQKLLSKCNDAPTLRFAKSFLKSHTEAHDICENKIKNLEDSYDTVSEPSSSDNPESYHSPTSMGQNFHTPTDLE